jgi:hypothetical protein
VARAVIASGFPRALELHFADASDGTPHALVCLEAAGRQAWSRVRAPIGAALPHLRRELVERLQATRDLLGDGDEALAAAVLRPAPWLALQQVAVHDGARFREREVRFGAARLSPEERQLLERCDGRKVAEAAPDTAARVMVRGLAEAGLIVV